MMKKRITIFVIIALVVAASIFYWQHQKGKNTLSWRIFEASNRTIISSITATGTINPVIQVNVGTEVSGKIEKIYKDFNDIVKRGELLAKLDTQTLEMALEDARIELRKNQMTANDNLIELNRAKELFEQNMIAQFELQRTQLTYDISMENIERANFAVQRAETNLNNAFIYSPIDGVIVSRAVDEGQTVAASLNAPTLFIIANNLDEMQIETQVDETDIGRIANGMRARFSIDAFADMFFFGEVRQIRLNPIVESNVVTYKVIISCTNPEKLIMPGMTANVEIIVNQVDNVLVIQERALQFRPTKEIWESFGLKWDDNLSVNTRVRMRQPVGAESVPTANIWILTDGIPQPFRIETGISDGSFIQVLSGLEPGQQVITGVIHPQVQSAAISAFGGAGGGMRVIRM